MSRIDLQELPSGQQFESDLCIVGGGIAGLVLADALRGSGRRVDLLEAGGAGEEAESQALYAAEMAGVLHLGTTEGRFRVYGGYSTHWGGQLLPLAAHDFQPRSHVPDSGWPLDPAELSPYLHRCEELLGANHAPFDASLIDQLPSPTPGNSPVPLQPSAARTCKRATASRSGKPPPPSSTASRGAFNCAWSWLQGMIFLVDRERHGGGSPRNAWFPFEPLAVEALPVAPHIWCGFWAWFLYEPKTTLPPPRGYWCTMTGAARARCG